MSESLANKKIVIIGLGLIGGSVARCLAGKQPAGEIIGVGRNEKVLRQAVDDGVITGYDTDVTCACEDADLVIVSVPVLTTETIFEAIKPVMSPNMVMTDAASVKGTIVDAAKKVFGEVPENFVPGHPIAGSEHSGYSASTADLFENKKVILTPLESTQASAVNLVTALWEAVGAEVLTMQVSRHDAVLAATSHLPHLLAFALVDTLSQQGESEEIFRYAAGGFRDFTRIASSDPQMWHDIFMTNGEATVEVLDTYIEDLGRLRKAVLDRDSDELMATFRRAKKSRDKFLALFSNGNPKKANREV